MRGTTAPVAYADNPRLRWPIRHKYGAVWVGCQQEGFDWLVDVARVSV